MAAAHSTDITLIECVTASCMVVSGCSAIYQLNDLSCCEHIIFVLGQNATACAEIYQTRRVFVFYQGHWALSKFVLLKMLFFTKHKQSPKQK